MKIHHHYHKGKGWQPCSIEPCLPDAVYSHLAIDGRPPRDAGDNCPPEGIERPSPARSLEYLIQWALGVVSQEEWGEKNLRLHFDIVEAGLLAGGWYD